MNELYWITRLDSIREFLSVVTTVCGVLTFGALLAVFFAHLEEKPGLARKSGKWGLALFAGALMFGLVYVFVPSTKDAYVMYGVGGTIEYLRENDTAKQLPDKAVKALDSLLDEINNTEKNDKKHGKTKADNEND